MKKRKKRRSSSLQFFLSLFKFIIIAVSTAGVMYWLLFHLFTIKKIECQIDKSKQNWPCSVDNNVLGKSIFFSKLDEKKTVLISINNTEELYQIKNIYKKFPSSIQLVVEPSKSLYRLQIDDTPARLVDENALLGPINDRELLVVVPSYIIGGNDLTKVNDKLHQAIMHIITAIREENIGVDSIVFELDNIVRIKQKDGVNILFNNDKTLITQVAKYRQLLNSDYMDEINKTIKEIDFRFKHVVVR